MTDPDMSVGSPNDRGHQDEIDECCREGGDHPCGPFLDQEREIERLRSALDNSQSLLAAMLHEKRPESEIEVQMVENRTALSASLA